MPDRNTLERVKRDQQQGKSPSTQAGEFVREEIEHIREGKHGARSAKQAIAIGLSKARRAGIALPPPRKGSPATRRKAVSEARGARAGSRRKSPTRARAALRTLKREPRRAASHAALARQARQAARKRRRASA